MGHAARDVGDAAGPGQPQPRPGIIATQRNVVEIAIRIDLPWPEELLGGEARQEGGRGATTSPSSIWRAINTHISSSGVYSGAISQLDEVGLRGPVQQLLAHGGLGAQVG